MAKTRLLSPFGSSRKKSDFGGEMTSPTGSETSVSTIGTGQRIEIQKTYNNGPFHHRSSTKITSPTTSDTSESNLNSITTSPPIKDGPNKRLARLQQAFLSGESSTLLPSSSSSSSNNSNTNTNAHLLPPATMEPKILEVLAEANRRGSEIENVSSTLSPSQRKTPGAFVGRNGSGVLLEGWLRQKQRRGIKGMKKWNSRYFVLYAKSNEIRYYTDVVQSAWGPIPLGEIGSISLRLIQRIGKPSHPKYKGCRFDITCRNSWGTHYAEDFISSDEEDEKTNTNTPNASRVYSLMADCPQTAVLWVNMLDSLLVRSANSPRPDMASTSSSSSAGNTPTTTTTNSTTTMTTTTMTSALKKMSSMKNSTTSSSSTNTQKKKKKNPSVNFDLENRIFTAPGEIVPKAVVYSMKYIFDSTPGIETESFYERDPDSNKLKNAIQFLNQFALEENTTKLNKKLSMDELENVLDPITGGAIIKLWLQQMEQPIIPFEMYPDFLSLAKEVKIAPFELQRNLKTLIAALPQKNL
jgi:uncharacterized membrane protein